jgi:hypothetical protein
MNRFFVLCVSGVALAACAGPEVPPPPPPPVAAAPPGTPTTFFDGTYYGSFAQNVSAPGSQCPNLTVAPALTINNGLARFAALDLNFQGYVTQQGELRMQAATGQTFVGHIDPYYGLRGQVTGNCVYNAIWQRKGATGQKPN